MKKRRLVLPVIGIAIIWIAIIFCKDFVTEINAAEEERILIPTNQTITLEEGKYFLKLSSCSKLIFNENWSTTMDLTYKEPGYYVADIDLGASCKKILRLPAGEYPINVYRELKDCRVDVIEESSDKYEQEFNDSFDTANNISTGVMYTGNLNRFCRNGDVDYFHFDLPSAGSVMIENERCVYSLFREDEITKNIVEIPYAFKHRLPAGSYFLVFEECKDEEYTFKVNYSQESKESFEQEINDELATANPINLDTAYTGNISTPDDIDYYMVDIVQKGDLSLYTEIPRQSNSVWTFELMSSDGTIYDQLTTNYNPVSIGNTIFVLPGKYYIKVTSRSYAGEDYKLTLKFKVQQKSSDCTLQKIIKTAGKWNKKFRSDQTKYILTLNAKNKKVGLVPVVSNDNAKYTINGEEWGGVEIRLSKGQKRVIRIKVTAENGETMTYLITVKKDR